MPRKTTPKRIRNPVATRAKLLRATMELVNEKGAAALSLKEAATRAKVSRGVAYLHFNDRDQLLKEAQSWISDGLHAVVTQFENASLHDRTFHTTKIVLENPEAAKLLMNAAMSGTDLDGSNPLYRLVLNMIKELKARGEARPDLDVQMATYLMFGSIAATLIMGVQHKDEDIDELSQRFALEWDTIMEKGMFAPGFRVAPKAAAVPKAPKPKAARKRTLRG